MERIYQRKRKSRSENYSSDVWSDDFKDYLEVIANRVEEIENVDIKRVLVKVRGRFYRNRLKIIDETKGTFSEGRKGQIFQYSTGWYNQDEFWTVSPFQHTNKLDNTIYWRSELRVMPKKDAVHYDVIDVIDVTKDKIK